MTQDKDGNAVATVAGPFDQTGLSDVRRARATAQLRRMEALVDMVFEGASSVAAVARLIGHGFNLMRHKVRMSDAGATPVRFEG